MLVLAACQLAEENRRLLEVLTEREAMSPREFVFPVGGVFVAANGVVFSKEPPIGNCWHCKATFVPQAPNSALCSACGKADHRKVDPYQGRTSDGL
jgi:Zn finger protein HypA/HybF involved in hydrogenase expression